MPSGRTAQRVAAALAAALCTAALTAFATRTHEPALRTTGPLTTTSSPEQATIPGTTGAAASPSATSPSATAAPTPRLTSKPRRTSEPVEGAVPTRLSIRRLGISVVVRPVGVDREGRIAIPEDLRKTGWYKFGPRPGASTGAAVLVAHVNTVKDGAGPFAHLRQAKVGDSVALQTSSGTLRYVIRSVQRIPKDRLDLDAVFARDGPAELHLLTCGGAFNRASGQYEDNVVVVAAPERG
ncbi:MAG: class F sortase [Intrasporangium sp.]|nr:class F sortase [Intrasporangium sp.]